MTNRYAFLSTEKQCQTVWSGQVFAVPPAKDLKSALLTDILCRQNGTALQTGDTPLRALGILCDGPVSEEAVHQAGVYGADAWRLAQILEKDTTQLAPYWRLIQKWFDLFKDVEPTSCNVITKELQFLPQTAALAKAVRRNDFYHTLTVTREALKNPTFSRKIAAAVLAPFVPHLLFSFLPEAPQVYKALRAFTGQAIALQVNGRFATMMLVIDDDFNRIQKEALKSPLIQRKIGKRYVQNCIYVPGKVFNVIC